MWASRFLSFGNNNEHLPLDIRIEQFLKEMETKKKLADWQLRQAEEAVRLYITQFLSGKTKTVSPNSPDDKTNLLLFNCRPFLCNYLQSFPDLFSLVLTVLVKTPFYIFRQNQ